MPPDSILGDRAKNPSHVRKENVPCTQPRCVLSLQRVGEIESLRRVLEVKEVSCDIRISFGIRNSKSCATLENVRPSRSTWEDFLP